MFYLSAAAKNAADVESLALQAGLKKGGAAKGELVLAIFELANCFRQGWGIEKDPIAAKQVCRFLVQLAMGDAVFGVARLGLSTGRRLCLCWTTSMVHDATANAVEGRIAHG